MPLSATDSIERVPGVNKARHEVLLRMGLHRVEDLLRLAPRRFEDRRHATPIHQLEADTSAFVVGTVLTSKTVRARGGLSILEATVEDESGAILARWFQRGYTPKPLAKGIRVALYGAPQKKGNTLFLSGPAREVLPQDDEALSNHPAAFRLVPVHPVTRGVTPMTMRKLVWAALPAVDSVQDRIPARYLDDHGLAPLATALRALHFPETEEGGEAARQRMAFDELYAHELRLLRVRRKRHKVKGIPIAFTDEIHRRIRARIPFALTEGQNTAVRSIVADLERGSPMRRLLQGDVGSGKTAVAAYAMLGAVARGWQVACMAPTEILARQHESTFATLLDGSRVRCAYIGRGLKTAERKKIAADIANGDINVVLGTHAVLGRDIHFARLGLVVVDEQHKFGVRQRRTLLHQGRDDHPPPHALIMSATPIPRTLAMTTYGDLDVSVIRGQIPGRKPIRTTIVGAKERDDAMTQVHQTLDRGEQIYVVYPLVEESEQLALRDAEASFKKWQRALPMRAVGLLHGKLKKPDKERVMNAFRAGEIDVLVATIVVEVGVDVPNATMIIIEHAERFGLSQLHQLRGRVGRGDRGGACLLFDRSKKGDTERLKVLVETDDGFQIAEEDLKRRGVGDVLGTRQHGQPQFHAASLPRDLPLLERARTIAESVAADATRDANRRPNRPRSS